MRLAKGRAAIIGIVFVRININDISFGYFLHSQVVDQYCGDEGIMQASTVGIRLLLRMLEGEVS